MLIIKQCLKFLNTLGFDLKHKIMFFAWQSHKITRAVIVFNPIKVVYYPSIGKELIMALFPYQDVFKDISSAIGVVMMWIFNEYVAVKTFISTALPIPVVFTNLCIMEFIEVVIASCQTFVITLFTCTTHTAKTSMVNKFATIKAGMLTPPCPFLVIFSSIPYHTYMLALSVAFVNKRQVMETANAYT